MHARHLAALAAITLGTILVPVTAASAATPVNWTQRTCALAASYAERPSRARLERLVEDSFHVAPKYLGADIGQLYADTLGGSNTDNDNEYIFEDCNNGYGS